MFQSVCCLRKFEPEHCASAPFIVFETITECFARMTGMFWNIPCTVGLIITAWRRHKNNKTKSGIWDLPNFYLLTDTSVYKILNSQILLHVQYTRTCTVHTYTYSTHVHVQYTRVCRSTFIGKFPLLTSTLLYVYKKCQPPQIL